jgi:quercetin dioxygenase-like cupin family protein
MVLTAVVHGDSPKKHMADAALYPVSEMNWKDGPPSLPAGAKVAVLEGDPGKPGPFVFRVKVPDGYRIPPHTHPKPERVTVISGTFHLGMGEKFDKGKAKAMPAGTYGTWPPGMKHFVGRSPTSIRQMTPARSNGLLGGHRRWTGERSGIPICNSHPPSGSRCRLDRPQ